MNLDSIRAYCLSLPHVTEDIQWENNLLFRVGGKMFAIVPLEPDSSLGRVALKSSPERCAELLEIEGIDRARYLGRYDWISLERFDVLQDAELRELLLASYEMVHAKLPKRTKESLWANGKRRRVYQDRAS